MAGRVRRRAPRMERAFYLAKRRLVPPQIAAIVVGALTLLGMILLAVLGGG